MNINLKNKIIILLEFQMKIQLTPYHGTVCIYNGSLVSKLI